MTKYLLTLCKRQREMRWSLIPLVSFFNEIKSFWMDYTIDSQCMTVTHIQITSERPEYSEIWLCVIAGHFWLNESYLSLEFHWQNEHIYYIYMDVSDLTELICIMKSYKRENLFLCYQLCVWCCWCMLYILTFVCVEILKCVLWNADVVCTGERKREI